MAEPTASILDSVKKSLGLGAEYDVFDPDIMMHINTVFVNLQQLGIGPLSGFMIEDANAVWSDFLGDQSLLNPVKTYVYLKVKLLFDPPGTSFHITAIENQIKEIEWRLSITRDELISMTPPIVIPVGTPTYPVVDGGGAD